MIFFFFAGLRRISPGTCRDQSQLRVHHSKLSIDFPEWKRSATAAHWLLKPVVSLARASVSQKDGVSITWGFPFFTSPWLSSPLFFPSLLFLQVFEGHDSPVIILALIQGAGRPPSQGRLLLVWHRPSKETPMDLHRAAFKMENSSYLPNPLASPALMVLASTAEASRDASIPCQQPRPFGVPVSVDKDVHIPFTNGSYTFASMYHRQGGVPGTFANRDFPPSLLHLHPQFAPPNLDCTPISMLNHSGVGAFRPFASTEDRESYQSAFTPAKRLKNCHDTESPHLRFSDADGKEYDFGAQLPSSSPGSLKVDDTGKKIFAVSGLISDRETSSSPEDRNDRCKYFDWSPLSTPPPP